MLERLFTLVIVAGLAGASLIASAPTYEFGFAAPEVAPKARIQPAQVKTLGKTTTIVRSADGLFHVPARIDGKPISMVFDTGASKTLISSRAISEMDQVNWVPGSSHRLQTLDGIVPFRVAKLSELTIGDHSIENIEIGVINTASDISVIGQDVIRTMGRVTIHEDTLEFTPRD